MQLSFTVFMIPGEKLFHFESSKRRTLMNVNFATFQNSLSYSLRTLQLLPQFSQSSKRQLYIILVRGGSISFPILTKLIKRQLKDTPFLIACAYISFHYSHEVEKEACSYTSMKIGFASCQRPTQGNKLVL